MGESFSPEIVAKLNETWLPDQAGKPSCLSLLNCLTTIIPHWMVLTEDEIERSANHGEGPPPESDAVRDRHLASGKLEWLRVRLPELLKQLSQPVEWCAFLKDIDVSDRSFLPSIWTNRSLDCIPKKLEWGIDGLQWKLLKYGQEHELPEGWETTGWNYYRLGIQPVRDIPELISHLKLRAKYVSRTVQNPFEGPTQRSDVLRLTFLNAQCAFQEWNHAPDRWPACGCSSIDFQPSQFQLGELIRELSEIAAKDAKAKVSYPAPLAEPEQLVLNDTCLNILNALDGKAMRVEELAKVVTEGETTRLYRDGLKSILEANGKIVRNAKIGYYRPDAPPQERVVKVVKLDAKK